MVFTRAFSLVMLGIVLADFVSAKTIDIRIGHQSLCTDTYSAGIVVKELKLLEKHLPHTGKYADATYNVAWSDYSSGGPITNQMLANKLDFGVMGDYPLIVNGAKFQATDSLRTKYISGTGYNLKGSGNSIVVPVNSDIYSIDQLKGKNVSVPVGSAAWGMLLKAMQDNNLNEDAVGLRNQSPAVGASNIAAQKIDAHADFCPWSELMEFRGTGRKIFDGSQAGVPYLHGVVAREDFLKMYPEIAIAFIEAINDASDWIRADPILASENMEKWTGVEKEVLYLYFSKGGILTLDPTIKPEWIEALKLDHSVLAKQQNIPALNFNEWIDQQYILKAYAAMHKDYAKEQAIIVDPAVANLGLPMEIWHSREGVSDYPTLAKFLVAVGNFQNTGQKLNATYVYDKKTGLKLFGKTAFYVKSKDGFSTFLLKRDAEIFAKSEGGAVMDMADAIAAEMELAQEDPADSAQPKLANN